MVRKASSAAWAGQPNLRARKALRARILQALHFYGSFHLASADPQILVVWSIKESVGWARAARRPRGAVPRSVPSEAVMRQGSGSTLEGLDEGPKKIWLENYNKCVIIHILTYGRELL